MIDTLAFLSGFAVGEIGRDLTIWNTNGVILR